MNIKKLNKILIIISIAIFVVGIISGFGLSIEIEKSLSSNPMYIDGTDISLLIGAVGLIASKLLGAFIVICSIGVVVIIWIVYAIILLLRKKNKEKR